MVTALTAAATLTACGSPTSRSTLPTLPGGGAPPAHLTVAVDTGFSRDETFCAQSPLTGHITYKVAGSDATLVLALSGLPKRQWVGLDWRNNNVRGYLIASFATDTDGKAIQGSLDFYRPGEVKGVGLVVTTQADQNVAGRLSAC